MKTFIFERKEDETGISGTGIVAEGVVFDNGKTVVSWLTKYPTISIYENISDALFLHGQPAKQNLLH